MRIDMEVVAKEVEVTGGTRILRINNPPDVKEPQYYSQSLTLTRYANGKAYASLVVDSFQLSDASMENKRIVTTAQIKTLSLMILVTYIVSTFFAIIAGTHLTIQLIALTGLFILMILSLKRLLKNKQKTR